MRWALSWGLLAASIFVVLRLAILVVYLLGFFQDAIEPTGLPLEEGVDVISVATAFKRFLEIARLLKQDVRVVTNNDGKVAALKKKYAEYLNGADSTIRICFDDDKDCPALESQLLQANSRDKLNAILGTTHADDTALLKHMEGNKTDCALKMFETDHTWDAPEYIANAIE